VGFMLWQVESSNEYRGRRMTSSRRSGLVSISWRILSWVLAVTLSLAVIAPIAYWTGLVTKSDVLNVFVGTGAGRYTRLAAFVTVWALVMTVLVTLFARIGRGVAQRRRISAVRP
jgi:hypothetical protein